MSTRSTPGTWSTCACHDAAVAINPKLLNEGERVVVTTRTHVKALFVPVLVLLLVAFVSAFLAAQARTQVDDGTARTALYVAVAATAALAVLAWVVRPFLAWFFTSYTFTDRRLIQRRGVISKEGRTIPLNRISGVDVDIGVLDRLVGCGTLVVSDASEHGRVELHDVPRVEQVHKCVAAELHVLGQQGPHGDDAHGDGT